MLSLKTDTESLIQHYKKNDHSDQLIDRFEYFLKKYHDLFCTDTIPFESYEVRYFLSCYIKEKKERGSLRSKYYHSKKDYKNAYQVLHYIQQAFHGYTKQEIYHELVIPFLQCARRYKYKNKSFRIYLNHTYKYELMRHINKLLFSNFTLDPTLELEIQIEEEHEIEEVEKLQIELHDTLALNHPLWLNGEDTKDPFDQFTREERLILVKYYFEGYSDTDIGRLVGRSRRSIGRSRLRVLRKLKSDIIGGRVKWVRWSQ